MTTLIRGMLGAVVSVCVGSVAVGQVAQPAAPQPAASTTAAAPNTVVILGSKGEARYRLKHDIPDKGWVDAKAGTTLTEGAELQTGGIGEHWIQLRIGETQLYTVGRMSFITVKQAVKKAGESVSTVSMEYGFMKVEVDSTRLANNVHIETPDVTLAVSGTGFWIQFTPGGKTRTGGLPDNTGVIQALYASGAVATLHGSQQSDSSTPAPAKLLADATIVDTTNSRARETDEKHVSDRSAGGGDAATVSIGLEPSTIAGNSAPPKQGQQVKKVDKATGQVSGITGPRQ